MKQITATGAGEHTSTITFKNEAHKRFYHEQILKCRTRDCYHKALMYCLGLTEETREHIKEIYDFEKGTVKPSCLKKAWNTGSSDKVIRIAFNLYCDGIPSVTNCRNKGEQIEECKAYSIAEIFCTGDAKYFWNAVQIRYPDYCFYRSWEDLYAKD